MKEIPKGRTEETKKVKVKKGRELGGGGRRKHSE
jgi:hypothetical protein